MQNKSTFKYINEAHFKNLFNWSVGSVLGNKLHYKEGFTLEPIGNLIVRNRTKEIIEDEKFYKQVTIKLYGKGVIQRGEELIQGKSIGTKNQFRISEGQFIMSKIDARNGAFGIVPKELEGAITTQDFLSYKINIDKILPEFFKLILTTEHFAKLCQRASSGTTGRQRVNEKEFLSFKIPVPLKPLQEEIISDYKEKVDLATKLNDDVKLLEERIKHLLSNSLGLPIEEPKERKKFNLINYKKIIFWGVDKILSSEKFNSSKYPTTTLTSSPELYIQAFRGKSPKYDKTGRFIILNQKCNRWNKIEIQHAKKVDSAWYESVDANLFTRKGDIIINSTGEGTIGRASFVTEDFKNLLIDSHMLLLRLNDNLLSPEYLVQIINSSYGQKQIEMLKSAKSTKQTELGIQNLFNISFPIPNIEIQEKLVLEIRNLNNEIENLIDYANDATDNATINFENQIFIISPDAN